MITGYPSTRQITNVAAGQVTTTSTDAINGSQLNAAVTAITTLSTSTAVGIGSLSTGLSTTNSNVASLSTGLSTTNSNVASLSTSTSTGISSLSTGLSSLSTTLSTATSATTSLSTGLSTTDSKVTSLSTAVNSLSTGVGNAVQYDDTTHAKVTLGGTSATAPVSLTNVAAGVNPNDAVNYGQLSSLATTVNNINNGNSTYFKFNDPTAPASQASGNGAISGGGGALASGDGSVALGKNATAAGTNSVAIGAGSVANDPNTVSFGAPGSERRLTNIAPGVNPTDATTVQQVNNAVASGVQKANSYTDQRINATNNAINDVAKHAYSGIAAATALTMIPEVDLGKSIAVGVGGATFQGHAAAAIGVSARLTENLKVKAGVGLSGGGQTYGGGMSYQW
ncbi:hypothetical protein BGV48_02425 [Burkholderia ubonensis]|nr:hypothetical protein BGV48_02425 [Burkholderia ubonensis]